MSEPGSSTRIPSKPKLSKAGLQKLQDKYFLAIYTRNMPEIMTCLSKGVNPNVRSPEYGVSPIHLLAERNDAVLAYRLITLPNFDINSRSLHGFTALHLTCIFGHKKFLLMLLQNGADPNAADRYNKRPLHYAVERESYSLIYNLLKYKANINVMDSFDNTPLSLSLIDVPNQLIARTLLRHKIDWSLEEKRNLHVFFECILSCNTVSDIDYIEMLLDFGVDINIKDKRTGRTCLHFVAITGFLDLAVFLVQRGAEFEVIDKAFQTPVNIAQDHRNLIVADYFRKGYRPPNLLKTLPLIKLWKTNVMKRIESRAAAEAAAEDQHHHK